MRRASGRKRTVIARSDGYRTDQADNRSRPQGRYESPEDDDGTDRTSPEVASASVDRDVYDMSPEELVADYARLRDTISRETAARFNETRRSFRNRLMEVSFMTVASGSCATAQPAGNSGNEANAVPVLQSPSRLRDRSARFCRTRAARS